MVAPTFAVCVRNEGYEASLERNKIYAVLPDDQAERDGDLRRGSSQRDPCLPSRKGPRRRDGRRSSDEADNRSSRSRHDRGKAENSTKWVPIDFLQPRKSGLTKWHTKRCVRHFRHAITDRQTMA